MWRWLAVFTAPVLARELEVTKELLRDAVNQNKAYERMIADYLQRKGTTMSEDTQEVRQSSGVNVTAPVQKVVQVGLGQVAHSLDAALATLDALEDIPYHAADTGLGLVHNTFEAAIKSLREGLEQAARDAQTAVDQVGGVATIGDR